MDVTPAGPVLPGITHHYCGGQRDQAALRRDGDQRIAGSAGPRVSRDLVGLPEAHPAAGGQPPGLRRRPARLRWLRQRAGEFGSKTSAEDLRLLIGQLGVGPVHLTGQDISGATVFRLAVTHPQDVLSLTAIEMGLAGFGLEMLADVTHGGSWHIGVLAAPGIPEMLLAGRERGSRANSRSRP